MANLEQYVPFFKKWEGGFSNHPADRGGPTYFGVTLATWQRVGYDKNGDRKITVADLKLMNHNDLVERVLRPHFWNLWQADRIHTQANAEVLVDWLCMSGPYSIRLAQKELKVEMDGIVGNRTLQAINEDGNQQNLFYRLKVARYAHLYRIVDYRPNNKVFLDGWINRVRDLKFTLSLLILVLSMATTACRSSQPAPASVYQKADSSLLIHRNNTVCDVIEMETVQQWIPLSPDYSIPTAGIAAPPVPLLHNSVPVAAPQATSIRTRVRRFRYATADTTAGTVLQRSSILQPTGRQPPPGKPETGNTRTSGRGSALSWVVWLIAGLLVAGVAFKLYRRN